MKYHILTFLYFKAHLRKKSNLNSRVEFMIFNFILKFCQKYKKEKILIEKSITRIYSEMSSVKEIFNLPARLSNLLAVAEISSIEAVCCSVEALIPAIE